MAIANVTLHLIFVFNHFILSGRSVKSIADFSIKQPRTILEEKGQGEKAVILYYPEMDKLEDQLREDTTTAVKMAPKRAAEDAPRLHKSEIRSKKSKLEGDCLKIGD